MNVPSFHGVNMSEKGHQVTVIPPELDAKQIKLNAASRARASLYLNGEGSVLLHEVQWSQEQDEALRAAVLKHGTSDWDVIEEALRVFRKSSIACKVRWQTIGTIKVKVFHYENEFICYLIVQTIGWMNALLCFAF